MSSRARVFLVFTAGGLLFAQRPSETPAPALTYQHQPLRLPLACRAEDFEAAGLDCSEEEPCRVFLELTAVDAAVSKVLLVGNLHTAVATVSAIALLSEDAGATWRQPVKGEPGGGFESVQFLDPQRAWISVLSQGSLAADPYLLATVDGGHTWQKLAIWTEEGRAGLLQLFQFDSKTHGLALIDRSAAGTFNDRYELYETLDGGASWVLRQISSRPITLKWTARRNPDWRLREDPKVKTYELERRAGESWVRMANFRAELGVCKTLERKGVAPEAGPERSPDPIP
ncbi:MAG: hypothetical protein HY236_18005 [Acidobacteria bacterium]|nr:hypothetical protein [Acidobacteriota bacterium]